MLAVHSTGFEFGLLLDWMPAKTRKPCLLGEQSNSYLCILCESEMQRPRLGFELDTSASFSGPIIATLGAHPLYFLNKKRNQF